MPPLYLARSYNGFCSIMGLIWRILKRGKGMKSNETLDLIEEITRKDGSKYYEISNIAQNGRAELAAVRALFKMFASYN